MDRKELIAILVLAALVVVAATVRLWRFPSPPSGGGSTTAQSLPPGLAQGHLVWPHPRSRYVPRTPRARRLFQAAEHTFEERLFEAAAATYRGFIARYPKEPTVEVARFRVAQCLTLAERHAEAAAQYEQFLKHHPQSQLRPAALLWSGISHAEAGDIAQARRRLQEVIDRYPTSAFAEGARQRLAHIADKPPEAEGDAP